MRDTPQNEVRRGCRYDSNFKLVESVRIHVHARRRHLPRVEAVIVSLIKQRARRLGCALRETRQSSLRSVIGIATLHPSDELRRVLAGSPDAFPYQGTAPVRRQLRLATSTPRPTCDTAFRATMRRIASAVVDGGSLCMSRGKQQFQRGPVLERHVGELASFIEPCMIISVNSRSISWGLSRCAKAAAALTSWRVA